MSKEAVWARREALARAHDRVHEAAALAAMADAQWWRLIKNWHRRQAALMLLAGCEKDHAAVDAAWSAMSASEQEAERGRILRSVLAVSRG